MIPRVRHLAHWILLLAAACAARAGDEPAFKFTAGAYHLSGGGLPSGNAIDLNLRYGGEIGNAWIGWFRSDALDVTQARAGWDRTFTVGPLRVQPSVQVASGGFAGGSLYAEAGDTFFAGAGIGRTNLRPYYNLNFDPNDAWTLSGGWRKDKRALTLLMVGDNRQNPDQRHVHLNWRSSDEQGERLTLDLLAKRGTVDGVRIHRIGFSATYDWPRWFARLAWDPKVNFTSQNMVRVAGGVRF